MWNIPNILKSIGGRLGAKSYLGVVDGNLPSTTKRWNKDDYLNALDISLYTSRAVDKRAEDVANIEFQVTNERGEVIENDPTLQLLYKPNKIFTGRQFWKLYQTYYDCIGEVYIYKEKGREIFENRGKVKALHLLNPLATRPVFSSTGEVEKFEFKSGTETKEYAAEDVLYIHNPDPKNPLKGQSLLRAGISAISTEAQIASYHSKILENGGKVEGVFKFKTDRIKKEDLARWKDEYRQEYAQAKKAGIPLFLGGDAEYVRTGLSPDELSYLEAKKTTFSDICIMTGVPEPLLSMKDVKYDNADASMTMYLAETIWPLMKVLYTALDEDQELFPIGRNLKAVNPTPENLDRKMKVLETANNINAMTLNEKREALGLDPVEGGKEIYAPFNLMPLTSEKMTEETAAKRFKGENMVHPLSDADYRKTYAKVMVKRMDAREKSFKAQLKKYFDEQKGRLIDALAPTKTRVFRKKDLIDDSLNIELEVKIGKDKFAPIVTELVKQAGLDAFDLTGNEYQFNITAGIGAWIENRTDIFMRSINKTTVKELKKQFEESLANGEGRENLITRIENTYENITKARAALIARTEVHNATQYGTMEGYKQGGLNTKIWVSVGDQYTRGADPSDEADHLSLDGEERPIDMPFSNGLMFPGDPRGSAAEVINCRCVI